MVDLTPDDFVSKSLRSFAFSFQSPDPFSYIVKTFRHCVGIWFVQAQRERKQRATGLGPQDSPLLPIALKLFPDVGGSSPVHSNSGAGRPFRPVLFNGQIAEHGKLAIFTMYKSDIGNMWLDNVYFLKRSNNQELQVQPFEQFQAVTR